MGFKGQSIVDTGYFYAPYIPLMQTPVILDVNDFKPRKGLITRYNKSNFQNQNWSTVNIGDVTPETTWKIKPKKKKIWRDITDDWGPSIDSV